MPSFDPTFYADCEVIIKTFEKAAAFSTDPRSVYAMNTPVLSNGIANCNNLDKQISIQMQSSQMNQNVDINKPGFTDNLKSNEPLSRTTASEAANASQESESQRQEEQPSQNSGSKSSQEERAPTSETPWSDNFQNGLQQMGIERCIPCAERFAGAELALTNFGESWKQYGELWQEIPRNFVRQLEQMVGMLKDRGRSTLLGLCEFIKSFQLLQCPSDLMRIIAALSAGLTKISIDIFGDLGMFFNLAKGILTGLLSAALQLIQSFIQRILDPINCMIDSFQKEFIGPIADFMETTSNLQGPWEFGTSFDSSWKDQDWTLQQDAGPQVPKDSPLSFIGDAGLGGKKIQPFKTEPKEVWSAVHDQPDTGSYKAYLKREEEINSLKASKPKPGSKQAGILKEKEKEQANEKFDKNIKALKDFNNSIDSVQAGFQNIFEATFTHLKNIATYIENLFSSWMEELGRLIGNSAVLEFGFFGKGMQKLSLITLLGTMTALIDFLRVRDCDNPSEALEKIIQESFTQYTDAVIKKEEDGTLSVFFGLIPSDVEATSPDMTYSFEDTGDEQMNMKIEQLANQIKQPAPTTMFTCNSAIPEDADAAQINKWMSELNTAGI